MPSLPPGLLRPVPAILLGVGAVAGAVGSGLGALGARDLVAAQKHEAAARARYEEQLATAEKHRSRVNETVQDYAALQQECFVGAVQRMVVWLRTHQKQVRESDRVLVDGLEASLALVPPAPDRTPEVAGWLAGVSRTAAAGLSTASAVSVAVEKFGVAGTGTKVADLAGAAREKAASAFLGGGPLKDGGGGIALGNAATKAAVGGVSLLGAGYSCKIQGTRALTRAEKVATDMEIACAELDEQRVKLYAVQDRAVELADVLTRLHQRATAAMDRLEALEFDSARHMGSFGEAVELVKAVQTVAQAPLIDESGNLSEQSATLRIRYRDMNGVKNHG